jgi:hypothetical protein
MAFSIENYLKENRIKMGNVTKSVTNNVFKGGHNDIRKTNYDVKITEDGKLDLYTEQKVVINEASEVKIIDIPAEKANQIKSFEKFFSGSHQTIWDGIHGYIVEIKVPTGKNRLDTKDLKDLSNMKLRWIEFDGQIASIGF